MKRQIIACLTSLAAVAVFTAFAFLCSAPAHAAVPVAKIQSVLAKPAMLCGRFDQTKHLAGMKKPLLSSGRFCVAPGKGVLWRTLQPFPNTLRLTRDEIVHMQGDRVSMRLDAKQEPVVKMINNVLFSLLAGDLGQLESFFDGTGSVDGNQWNVALKARDAGLARVISSVNLDGGPFVKNIVLHEASGDRTSIAFSAMQTGDAAMLPEEAAQF